MKILIMLVLLAGCTVNSWTCAGGPRNGEKCHTDGECWYGNCVLSVS